MKHLRKFNENIDDQKLAEEAVKELNDIWWEMNSMGIYPKIDITPDNPGQYYIFIEITTDFKNGKLIDQSVKWGDIKHMVVTGFEEIEEKFIPTQVWWKLTSKKTPGRENAHWSKFKDQLSDDTELQFLAIQLYQVHQNIYHDGQRTNDFPI